VGLGLVIFWGGGSK